jgi:K+-sensing histidine kinase KdpD
VVPLLITLALLPARALLTTTDVAMLQLLWVTWIAQQAGQRWAIITTINSVVLLDFLFVAPYYTLYVHHIDYLITFIVMLLLGIFIGRLSGRLRVELARAKKHMRQRQLLGGKTRQARMQAKLEHSRAMMLRSISHDLRTPLATIMGASSMLADKELQLSEAEVREQAGNIYRQSSLLSEHFDKVMELSRVQQPQSTMQLESLAVTDVISAAIARRAALLATQPFEVQLVTADCFADATLLEIALANMLENAVKHGQAPVSINFTRQNGHFMLSVCNAAAPKRNVQRDSGTGLGTAICKAVMHLHNGDFSLQHDTEHACVTALLRWPQSSNNGVQHG